MYIKSEICPDIKQECDEQENSDVSLDTDFKIEDDLFIEDEVLQKAIVQYSQYIEKEKDNDLVCILCHKYFLNSYNLYQHNIKHLIIPTEKLIYYFCDNCPEYFDDKTVLVAHIKNGHGPKLNVKMSECNICHKVYRYKNWHEHMRTVHSTEKPRCNKCMKHFGCYKNLKRHIKYVHDNVKTPNKRYNALNVVKCQICFKEYDNKHCLRTHVRNCHSESAECNICHSKLKSLSYLYTHMNRVHYNDGKLYGCDVCNKTFRSPRYLKIHKNNSHSIKARLKFERPKK